MAASKLVTFLARSVRRDDVGLSVTPAARVTVDRAAKRTSIGSLDTVENLIMA